MDLTGLALRLRHGSGADGFHCSLCVSFQRPTNFKSIWAYRPLASTALSQFLSLNISFSSCVMACMPTVSLSVATLIGLSPETSPSVPLATFGAHKTLTQTHTVSAEGKRNSRLRGCFPQCRLTVNSSNVHCSERRMLMEPLL